MWGKLSNFGSVILKDWEKYLNTNGAGHWNPKLWMTKAVCPPKLAHLPLNKITDISQTLSDAFSFIEKFCIWIVMSLKFVPKAPIDNKSALVQAMTWCWTNNKPLSEPMLTQFTDAYMWHLGGDELKVWLLMPWQCKEPKRQLWYLPCFSRIFRFHWQKG